jgi:hypothetical protein
MKPHEQLIKNNNKKLLQPIKTTFDNTPRIKFEIVEEENIIEEKIIKTINKADKN